jgi:ribosome-associated translation inhibitor RaiA
MVLREMCVFNMAINYENWMYNEDLAWDAIEKIENAVERRLNKREARSLQEKRNFNGYEELHEIQINGRLVFLGENPGAEEQYMVGEFKNDNPLGLYESTWAGLTNDYLEALDKFNDFLEDNINIVKTERESRDKMHSVEHIMLTAVHCVPNGLNEDLTGKVIIIKPEVLTPEFRRSDHQLKICTGGFGANPNSRGNAVFCTDLFSDKGSRFERHDVLGVADTQRLPEWAVRKIKSMEVQKEPPVKVESATKEKPSLLAGLDDAKKEAETQNTKHKPAPGKELKKKHEQEV